MTKKDNERPQDKLARLLVDACLAELEGDGQIPNRSAGFLNVCRQVVNDSGGDYLLNLDKVLRLAEGTMPKRPELPELKKVD